MTVAENAWFGLVRCTKLGLAKIYGRGAVVAIMLAPTTYSMETAGPARSASRMEGSTVFTFHRGALVVLSAVLLPGTMLSAGQETGRTKVAEGEYKVTMEGDLGCGPIETEIFHFHESWTLWKTAEGYDLEGNRSYESPRDESHEDRFVAKLARDLADRRMR